ncbi:sensor histidine kinase [Fluviispira sanaruensis]|uniref:histidine kinase n=1 Tax=Fluviispira sanaruensis TaxID=2493639 RepID=A0A4V0P2B6_FLUSA|nr:HAMP domain-containing sensor histidine kinase [Fluviispira sanaruensis]BBH52657.1 sensor histidine kinase [Fluviispira sanaruensis]
MFVWIRWYILRSQEINSLIEKISLPATSSGQWVILAQGCILMGFILIALYMIFVSQRRLSRITKMQDTILSSVTHELKTPLASIRLYAETMLLRAVSEEEKKKFLRRTLSETERLQRLIDTVLISARLESDKSSLAHVRVNLSELFANCCNQVKDRFSESRSFDFQLNSPNDEKEFFVWGNPYHLSMLFDNLLDNAVKYTEKGGSIVAGILQKKEVVQVFIKDNGQGIEKNNLKKVFKKFYRVERNSKLKVQGSGLGLSVCHSIVKEHHGKLYAMSEGLNKGTTFYVELQRLSPNSGR